MKGLGFSLKLKFKVRVAVSESERGRSGDRVILVACFSGSLRPRASHKERWTLSLNELEQEVYNTGFSSEIGTKLRDWAVGQAGGSCYSRAALSSNDSKTL